LFSKNSSYELNSCRSEKTITHEVALLKNRVALIFCLKDKIMVVVFISLISPF